MEKQTATLTMEADPAGVWTNVEAALGGMHQVLSVARHLVAAQPADAEGRWEMESGSVVNPEEGGELRRDPRGRDRDVRTGVHEVDRHGAGGVA